MIKKLIHGPIFLAQKSENATIEDKQVAIDLLDTLVAHKDSCVGVAANMIGVKKRIIAFDNNGEQHGYVQPGNNQKERPIRRRRWMLIPSWWSTQMQTI